MINTTKIKNLLQPGANAVFGDYHEYDLQFKKVFTTEMSNKAFEYDIEMKYLKQAAIYQEGAPVPVDDMQQAYVTSYYHKNLGTSFVITENAMEDNLYKDEFPKALKSLKKALHNAEDTLAASVFNNGFNAAYPIGDGQPLFSTQHPLIAGGYLANTLSVQQDLSEGSLETALTTIGLYRDQAGNLCEVLPQKLLTTPYNQWAASRLLKSSYQANSNNNAINVINQEDRIPQGYITNPFLSADYPNFWAIITNADNGLKHFLRRKMRVDFYTDTTTNNLVATASERLSFGASNPRCVFGSQGTNV